MIARVAEWITGPPGSAWTTSALPHSSMTTARRAGSAASGSYVEFSRSTLRRPQTLPSVAGWARIDAGEGQGLRSKHRGAR